MLRVIKMRGLAVAANINYYKPVACILLLVRRLLFSQSQGPALKDVRKILRKHKI